MKRIEIADKLVKFINGVVNNFAIIILVLLMLVSIYAIFDKQAVYEDAKIGEDIEALKPKDDDITFTLDELLKINPDIGAWIKINDTGIDYPVVQGTDNIKYLIHNFKGEDTGSGSIFLDYRNDVNFGDDYTIIYGHNLQSDLMFSDILNFKNKKYFNSHRKGRLYGLSAQYQIEIFCYAVIDSSKENIYNLDKYRKGYNDYLLELFKKYAVNYKDIGVTANDKLLVLSTCDDVGAYNRAVLLAKITKDVDIATTTITTKESKLTDERMQPTVQEYAMPVPKKEDLRINLVPHVSTYNLLLTMAILFVLGIYGVLIKEKLQKRQRKVAMATAGASQQQAQVQYEEPQILQVFDVNDFFVQEPQIYQVFDVQDTDDDIL